jgi:CHAD domain-containing protein
MKRHEKPVVPDKWIDLDPARDTVRDAAVRALESRLLAVVACLAAVSGPGLKRAESVHRLRVWSRRATAALDLYETLLPGKAYARLRRYLRRLRRAANDARNGDVLLARLKSAATREADRWRAAVRAERPEALAALAAAVAKMRDGRRFETRARALLATLKARTGRKGGADPVGPWAERRLRKFAKRFFAAVPRSRADDDAFHAFRIRGKSLRYVIELLAGAFPATLRSRLYPALATLQDRLGAVNDGVTALAGLTARKKAAATPADAAAWARLIARERTALTRARSAYATRATPKRLRDLRAAFDALGVRAAPPRRGSDGAGRRS